MDLETDSMIQQTIQTEFKDKTLICIARESIPPKSIYKGDNIVTHVDRLRTIMSYDRILVLDSGNIAVSLLLK